MKDSHSASKTRSGRPGWSITFRHPLRQDARGRTGLKIRRGLNTTDDALADELVEQLNILLADRSWWSADRRIDAEQKFSPQIVSAFFDGLDEKTSASTVFSAEAARLDAELRKLHKRGQFSAALELIREALEKAYRDGPAVVIGEDPEPILDAE